ncbi:hypothetical protein COF53_14875 [Bacillus pseudomycoides]|nr:hypothetical protein [Bacillus pseudomycoides]PHE46926.1 hypothetical protein COF53_14875 [Bacillus pseudomycoides]
MERQNGFLKFVRSKGSQYVYLAKGIKESGKKKTVTIFGFGKMPNALERLYNWRDEYDSLFPNELKQMNYDWHDLNEWILSLETGYSKKGRKLIIAKK